MILFRLHLIFVDAGLKLGRRRPPPWRPARPRFPIAAEPARMPTIGATMPFCVNCGATYAVGSTQCPSCSAPLGQGQQGGQPPQYGQQPMYPPQPGYAVPVYIAAQPKNHTVAILLCFFLGFLGIHRFYMGRVASGLIMLALNIISAGLLSIWTYIDMIILTFSNFNDSNGMPLAEKSMALSIILFIIYTIGLIAIIILVILPLVAAALLLLAAIFG